MAVPADLSGRSSDLSGSGMSPRRTDLLSCTARPSGAKNRASAPPQSDPQIPTPVTVQRGIYSGGGIFHGHIPLLRSRIVLSCLWLGRFCPCPRCRSRGGESGGSDPPFSGLVQPWTPLLFHIAGVVGPPSPGGVAPVTMILAGRLGFRRHDRPCNGLTFFSLSLALRLRPRGICRVRFPTDRSTRSWRSWP